MPASLAAPLPQVGYAPAMSRVVIAGAGTLGQALAARLSSTHDVRLVRSGDGLPPSSGRLTSWQADLTAIPEAEVALSGAHTVVMLAQTRSVPARLPRAALVDLDRLLADSVARAAKLVGAQHLVLFACGDEDVRPALLERAGVPLTVLRGGGPDPVEALARAVESGPGTSTSTEPWTGETAAPRALRMPTCSVQRFRRPPGWSALQVARAYFEWLPTDSALAKTSSMHDVFTIRALGRKALVLQLVPGRSNEDCAWFDISDGVLAHRAWGARFEFRVLLDEQTVLTSLIGYRPSLPWALYRASQAVLHERVMRRFGLWLEEQK